MIWLLSFIPLIAWLYLLFGRGMFWMTREHDDRDAPLPEAWPSVVAVARGLNSDKLTVMTGAARPAGWTGKLWAVKQGIAAAGIVFRRRSGLRCR